MSGKEHMPKILISSVPISGTNLLLRIIPGIPGLTRIDETAFFQLEPNQFAAAHIAYDKEVSEKLKDHSIKQIFIYHDPRDVVVSLRHFINNTLHDHPLFTVFKN